jgi:hypothetical protein
MNEPEVVALCGSVRFASEHLAAHWRLSLEGCVVLVPALPVEGEGEPGAVKDLLGSLHRRKIDMCDRIHVVNPGGYVGRSTASEIAYAQSLGKRITYEHGVTS